MSHFLGSWPGYACSHSHFMQTWRILLSLFDVFVCVPQSFKIKDTDGHKEVFEQTSSLCNSLRFRTQQIPNVAKVRVYRVIIHACAIAPFASLWSVLRQLILFGQFYIPSILRRYLVLTPVRWTFGIPLEWCHRFSDSIFVQFVTFSETTDTKCSEGKRSEAALQYW